MKYFAEEQGANVLDQVFDLTFPDPWPPRTGVTTVLFVMRRGKEQMFIINHHKMICISISWAFVIFIAWILMLNHNVGLFALLAKGDVQGMDSSMTDGYNFIINV